MARATRSEILEQLPDARAREARARRTGRRAVAVSYDATSDRMMMELSNGFFLGFPPSAIPSLRGASAAELAEVRLSAGGGALHWDTLDIDLSVAGLLLACVDRPAKLRELARLAGGSRSEAKAAAARLNGAKGGRPRRSGKA